MADTGQSTTVSTSYITAGNDAGNVRVVKQGAVFLYHTGDESFKAPTGTDWTPGSAKPIGYFSEDGFTLHPEPGDETEIKGHNGDTVYYDRSGGYWTAQVVGLECRKTVLEAYFGAAPNDTGGFDLSDAATTTAWEVVVVGMDQNDKPLLIHLENAVVSDRGDMQGLYTDTLKFDLTLRARNGSGTHKMVHVYGLSTE